MIILKFILRVVAIIVLVPVLWLAVWYIQSFFPHIDELHAISERGQLSMVNNKELFYKYAVAAESKEGIRKSATGMAYWSLVFSKNRPKNNLSWHFDNLFWYLASFIHFNEQDIFGIWINCAFYGCGRGLNEVSRIYYDKGLSELSKKELAGIAAFVTNPPLYKPGSKKSEDRIKQIIDKSNNS